MAAFTPNYGYQYHSYPLYSQETSYEGSFKRFGSFPTPREVFDYALFGLPKIFPLTNEVIDPETIVPFLESSITEIEQDIGVNLSPVTHFHSEDYIDGMFTENFMGMRLQRWPATEITSVRLKYPHTNTQNTYQEYAIPPDWVYLRRNKVNIVAAIGAISAQTNSPNVATSGGIFTYITGFGRGSYQPGTIEVVYKAGFQDDRLPSFVADYIKTHAALRYLVDVTPVLFPNSSVNVAIDGVSQSVTYNIQQLLTARMENLEKKKNELKRAFKKGFGRTVEMSFNGS